jgi:hypothetical protein
LVTDQAGVAVAVGAQEIPPRDVKVAFEKPYEGKLFSFSAGDCTGMTEIAAADFQRGKALAEYWRGTRLNTQLGTKSAPPPADL